MRKALVPVVVAIIVAVLSIGAYIGTQPLPPTPTPTSAPSPEVTPPPSPTPAPMVTPTPTSPVTPTPTPTPTPTLTPTPSPSPTPTVTPTPTPTVTHGNVSVYFIDVGQGDSMFIDTNGKDVLIDGGPGSAGDTVSNYLVSLNITKIDIIVGTHPHEDHIGGLIAVMTVMDVSSVLDNDHEKDTQTYRDYIALAKQRPITIAVRGLTVQLDDATIMTVLAPRQPLEFTGTNDNSIVVKVEVNDVSFLFTGDAEAEAEASILNAELDVDSDILKVGHHGSRTSTSQAFLDAVSPEIAVISVGEGNRYDHPHQETLDKLAARDIDIYRTDLHGTVIVTTDGASYVVRSER
ncbi:MAG: ComEC/Rec2 family competence protein [Candidatus Bathyarchaeia archaeon]